MVEAKPSYVGRVVVGRVGVVRLVDRVVLVVVGATHTKSIGFGAAFYIAKQI